MPDHRSGRLREIACFFEHLLYTAIIFCVWVWEYMMRRQRILRVFTQAPPSSYAFPLTRNCRQPQCRLSASSAPVDWAPLTCQQPLRLPSHPLLYHTRLNDGPSPVHDLPFNQLIRVLLLKMAPNQPTFPRGTTRILHSPCRSKKKRPIASH